MELLRKPKTQISVVVALFVAAIIFLILDTLTHLTGFQVLFEATSVLLLAVASLSTIRGMNAAIKSFHQLRLVADSTQDLENSLGAVNSKIEKNTEELSEVTRKVALLNPIIRNTAGSVGRMAPLVRGLSQGDSSQAAALTKAVGAPNTPAQSTTETTRSQGKITFPPVRPVKPAAPSSDITAMVIADPFTAEAFAYEWNQILPTKTSWKQILDEQRIDLLFVESAWEGNNGEWKYQFTGSLAPRAEIVALVEECKKRGIPTCFWNKEDPPHFEDFLDTAKLFDYVFTTDINMVPEYRKRLRHDRIEVLPFAAQPRIHNPAKIRGVARDKDVTFGGMYFRDKYPERRAQMDFLLPAAAKFNFDIFSRQLGGAPQYQFPAQYDKAVRNSLPYDQMLTAYHAYKTVLNVNSVTNSASMCARRIFEATACGAAVVSAPSPAISQFYPNDLVTVADDEKSAYQKLRILTRSDEFRERQVHLAQRLTWSHYTYEKRVDTVLETIGITPARKRQTISIISPTIRPENLSIIFENFGRQSYGDKQLLISCHGFEPDENQLRNLSTKHGIDNCKVVASPPENSLADNLNELIELADGDVIARMDDDDWYGENYLLDLYNALVFSQADVVGKAASYIYFEEPDMTVLTMPQMEHKYTEFVRGATLMGLKSTFLQFPFPNGTRGEDSDFLTSLVKANKLIYSADRFNFSVTRNKSKDSHTWNAADDFLFGTGVMKYIGRSIEQISL
ncbi:glycosyltransferase [Corynebacterium sp. HMSC04H06]|uniref:glycosyltransferase family protein n=1 Tax=Corynebacterium sp. HMSC04H06 TaxID=1581050 RepID=UPI000AF8DE44|nr:glycosyltransferase [Corynebacterium sp. HMSC04H06]